MTTKEFALRMNRVLENAKYFAMVGYHCSVNFSIESSTCELSIFYKDDQDEEFISSSSDLHVKFDTSNNTKWATLS